MQKIFKVSVSIVSTVFYFDHLDFTNGKELSLKLFECILNEGEVKILLLKFSFLKNCFHLKKT